MDWVYLEGKLEMVGGEAVLPPRFRRRLGDVTHANPSNSSQAGPGVDAT
jgi:hypothetical protein